MKNIFLKSFIIGIVLLGFTSASQADSIATFSTITPQLITNNLADQALPGFSVPQFNAALGTLTSVVLDVQPLLTGSGVGIFNISNPTGTVVQAGYTSVGSGGINGYTGSVSVASIPGLSGGWSSGVDVENLTLTNGAFTIANYVLQNLPVPGAGPQVTLTGGAVTPFVGAGNLPLAATAYADWYVTLTAAPSSADVGANPLAGAFLGVIYNYTAVPEPTTVLLVAFGGLTVFLFGRRSRK